MKLRLLAICGVFIVLLLTPVLLFLVVIDLICEASKAAYHATIYNWNKHVKQWFVNIKDIAKVIKTGKRIGDD